jgi:hypothetical protein
MWGVCANIQFIPVATRAPERPGSLSCQGKSSREGGQEMRKGGRGEKEREKE